MINQLLNLPSTLSFATGLLLWIAASSVHAQVKSPVKDKVVAETNTKLDFENDSTETTKSSAKTKAEIEAACEEEKDREEYYELLMIFADTMDQIDRNYVEKVSRRELMEAAIEGVLRKLDPYSNYIASDELDEFKVDVENEFGGVGIQISKRNGPLRVISPIVGTPAYKAGIVSNEMILDIDGKPTKDMSIADAIGLMKGRAGTDVTLTIFNPATSSTRQVVLTRDVIKVETVLSDRRNPDDTWKYMYDNQAKIGYVRITTFGRETATDLRDVLDALVEQGMQGLILDLRFNPGGLLKSAIEVSDMFLSSGRIVGTQGRNIKPQAWDATEAKTFSGFPMVVMVNQYSASASEIVAAALQDHERAVVVGEQTFGKASVQNVVELEGGKSALKITTGSYERPSGQPIHRFPDAKEWGVQPNPTFEVELTAYEMQQLTSRRRDRDIVRGRFEAEPSSNFDPQIRRALSHLKNETEQTE